MKPTMHQSISIQVSTYKYKTILTNIEKFRQITTLDYNTYHYIPGDSLEKLENLNPLFGKWIGIWQRQPELLVS